MEELAVRPLLEKHPQQTVYHPQGFLIALSLIALHIVLLGPMPMLLALHHLYFEQLVVVLVHSLLDVVLLGVGIALFLCGFFFGLDVLVDLELASEEDLQAVE